MCQDSRQYSLQPTKWQLLWNNNLHNLHNSCPLQCMAFFLLTSQENKGVFFCQNFKIIYINLEVIWFSSFTLCIYNIHLCISSKGDVQWEIIFYSSFIGYTFHTGCKVLCNKHVHILVQQIIILNSISMVDWNLFLYIVQYFHVVLVFFHSILKAPKLWMNFLGIFLKS